MDWTLFLGVTTAAAGLATAFSTTVVLWFRRRDRAEADWALYGRGVQEVSEGYGGSGVPGVYGRIYNAGDGAAFRVHVDGTKCRAWMTEESSSGAYRGPDLMPFVALIAPGEQVRLRVDCERDVWNVAEVVISWIAPPTRLKKQHTLTVPLREIAELPRPREVA